MSAGPRRESGPCLFQLPEACWPSWPCSYLIPVCLLIKILVATVRAHPDNPGSSPHPQIIQHNHACKVSGVVKGNIYRSGGCWWREPGHAWYPTVVSTCCKGDFGVVALRICKKEPIVGKKNLATLPCPRTKTE